MKRALRRRYGRARLALGPGERHDAQSDTLRRNKLTAKNRGDFSSALYSAAYYAEKTGRTMHVYRGNSYGHEVWRVSAEPSEYLNSINNTGAKVVSVTPALTVTYHEVKR